MFVILNDLRLIEHVSKTELISHDLRVSNIITVSKTSSADGISTVTTLSFIARNSDLNPLLNPQ